MSTPTRYYKLVPVGEPDSTPRLVEATSQSQALRHVAIDSFSVSIPTQKELYDLAINGIELEHAVATETASNS